MKGVVKRKDEIADVCERLQRKCVVNVYGIIKDDFAMSVLANMSAVKICSYKWLILHGLGCMDIQDRNMIRAEC